MNFSALKVFRAKEKRDEVIQAITSMASLAVDAIEIFSLFSPRFVGVEAGKTDFARPLSA
jgi:hypothetical protein